VATPNYSYEKRQRELAKKRKKEEKAARKAQGGRTNGEPGDAANQGPAHAESSNGEPTVEPPSEG
jgi:hypothetical protein